MAKRSRSLTFTLAGMIATVTMSAVCFAYIRAAGIVSTALFIVSPLPTAAYILYIRSAMKRTDTTDQSQTPPADIALAFGLVFAAGTSLFLVGTGLALLKNQP